MKTPPATSPPEAAIVPDSEQLGVVCLDLVLPRSSFRYRCAHCGKITRRTTDKMLPKRWIKSYCEATGKNVRLQLMPAVDEITRTVRALKTRGLWKQNAGGDGRRESTPLQQ
jgi:hypothetical protein